MLLASSLWAVPTYYSIVPTAAWTSTSAWSILSCGGLSCGTAPSALGNVEICTGTIITFTGAFTVGPGGNISSLTIDNGGTLIVDGDVTFKNGSTVLINSGGSLVINGSLTNSNNSTNITDNGSISVSAGETLGTHSTIVGSGCVTFTGTSSGSGTAFGSSACSNCSRCNTALPITLISFTASYNSKAVLLSFSTATEINNKYFTIDRSTDGVTYTTIDTIAGAGNSTYVRDYSSEDINPVNGVNYYRLNQTDYYGENTHLQVTEATVNIPVNGLEILPNPAKDNFIVSFNDAIYESLRISIYDYTGRAVMVHNTEAVKGSNAIEVNISSLSKGLYFISTTIKGAVLNAKLIKN